MVKQDVHRGKIGQKKEPGKQKEKIDDLFYLNVQCIYCDGSEEISVLDDQLFTNVEDAIDYGKQYLIKEGKQLGMESSQIEDSIDASYSTFEGLFSRGYLNFEMYDVSYKLEIDTIDHNALCRIINNGIIDELYYISSFSTLYIIEDDEVIEPDETTYKHVLENGLLSYKEALKLIASYMKVSEQESKELFVRKDDDYNFIICGKLSDFYGFERRFTVHPFPVKNLTNLLTSCSLRLREGSSDQSFIKLDPNVVNQFIQKYNDDRVLRWIQECEYYMY